MILLIHKLEKLWLKKEKKLSRLMAEDIQNAGIKSVDVLVEDKVIKSN